MLSILIPTYNYCIFPLVEELLIQVKKCTIDYEIVTLADGSDTFLAENQKINNLDNCSYEVLEHNIGRSAIRNLLVQKAKFENLLFLDADVIPVGEDFISNYIAVIDREQKVVYGGIRYQQQQPEREQMLRWVYGNSREALSAEQRNKNPYLCFLTLHFLIKKSIFKIVTFNEEIHGYGHEDTLFSFDLKQKGILIKHIENPVYHLGLDNSRIFLRKSEEAVENLKFLIESGLVDSAYTKLGCIYIRLKKYRLRSLVQFCYKIAKPILLRNLFSKNPSLYIFDLFRLGYFCDIKKE